MPKTSEAAVRCFARTGYYATTIEDVVRETGLSRGALYLYFPSKEALYLAISERWNCGMEAAIRARARPSSLLPRPCACSSRSMESRCRRKPMPAACSWRAGT